MGKSGVQNRPLATTYTGFCQALSVSIRFLLSHFLSHGVMGVMVACVHVDSVIVPG